MRLTLKDCYDRLNPVCCELLPIYLRPAHLSLQARGKQSGIRRRQKGVVHEVRQGKCVCTVKPGKAGTHFVGFPPSGRISCNIVICLKLCCVLSSAQGRAAYFPDLI